MKTNTCVSCFSPLGPNLAAGSNCSTCSAELAHQAAIRIASGDQADIIVENAAIEAFGVYWACEWQSVTGNGEDEPVEVVSEGFSAHASKRGAQTAAGWHLNAGRSAWVTGPHHTESAATN